jgi:hypothetical protein
MTDLDVILYQALTADADLMEAVGGRIQSTCFEVGPDEPDNTPLPYIIVTDDGFQNQQTTKDYLWESIEDRVQATIEIGAASKNEVQTLLKACRRAVENQISHLAEQGEAIPQLEGLRSDGIAWDWMKPCYYTHLIYECTINTEDNE